MSYRPMAVRKVCRVRHALPPDTRRWYVSTTARTVRTRQGNWMTGTAQQGNFRLHPERTFSVPDAAFKPPSLPLVADTTANRVPSTAAAYPALDLDVVGDTRGEAECHSAVALIAGRPDTHRDGFAQVHLWNHRQRGGARHTRIGFPGDRVHALLHGSQLRHVHRIGAIDARSDIRDATLVARRSDRNRIRFASHRIRAERHRVSRRSRGIRTERHAFTARHDGIRPDHRGAVRASIRAIAERDAVRAGSRGVRPDRDRVHARSAVIGVVRLLLAVVIHAVVMRA